MMEERDPGLRAPVYASLALAFASFGDAFLYPYLPVNCARAGVSIVWVGVLLSINRFVRIIANALMIRLFSLYGLRTVIIVAAALAIISTAGYSFAFGFLTWLLFRIFWGLAFSALRIGALGYALEQSSPGLAFGVSRSLQEAGPMLALLLAPLLLKRFDPGLIFILLAAASLPALYFAIKLPVKNDKPILQKSKSDLRFPSAFNSITLVSAFMMDGLLVVTLGMLFLQYGEGITPLIATALAAGFLAYRRICLVVLSTAGGWIADRIGFEKVFILSMLFMIAGLFVLTAGSIAAGTVVVFTFYSVYSAVVPGSASRQQQSPLAAVAENATWRDIGAAMGTLAGGMLLASQYLLTMLLIATFALLTLLIVQMGTIKKARKILYSWK